MLAKEWTLENSKVKMCTHCKREKSEIDFYKKGSRRDAKCKDCARAKRKQRYWKSQRRLKRFQTRHISKVVMKANPRTDQQFKRDMEVVKSILAKRLVELLKEKSNVA